MKAAWVVILVAACGAKKQEDPPGDKPSPKPTEESKKPAGSRDGFYRIVSITVEGKTTDIADQYRASIKGDYKVEVDFARMTLELDKGKLSVGFENVLGNPGDVSYCSVFATTDFVLEKDHFTISGLQAVASAGVAKSKGKDTSTDSTKCNVSLTAGTYTFKGSGKKLDLETIAGDGKPLSLELAVDERDVDLKERAKRFSKR